MSETKKIIKKTKPSVVRSFRLIDFHIYDESPKTEDSDSGSDDGRYKKHEDDKDFIIQMILSVSGKKVWENIFSQRSFLCIAQQG